MTRMNLRRAASWLVGMVLTALGLGVQAVTPTQIGFEAVGASGAKNQHVTVSLRVKNPPVLSFSGLNLNIGFNFDPNQLDLLNVHLGSGLSPSLFDFDGGRGVGRDPNPACERASPHASPAVCDSNPGVSISPRNSGTQVDVPLDGLEILTVNFRILAGGPGTSEVDFFCTAIGSADTCVEGAYDPNPITAFVARTAQVPEPHGVALVACALLLLAALRLRARRARA